MFFTQNPIGSSANEDLQDNAISFDYAMNSPAALWQDRFGKQHKTVQQALKDVGFKPAGFDFVSGGTLGIGDRDKCVFYPTDGYWYSWNGKLPYVVPANSSPTPGGKKGWKLVNELLEKIFAKIDGASLIGSGNYDDIRNYTGALSVINCYGRNSIFDGAAGVFKLDGTDTTSVDNGATVLIDALGRRWKRLFTGAVKLAWFGVDSTGVESFGIQNAIAFNNAIATGKSVELEHGAEYVVTPYIDDIDEAGNTTLAIRLRSQTHLFCPGKCTIRISNNFSTDSHPKRHAMFFSNDFLNDITFDGIVMDMNGYNNKISPNRGSLSFNRYTNAQICFSGTKAGVAAGANNVTVKNCTFKRNAGVSCIVMAQSNLPGVKLGKTWRLLNNEFSDVGIDTDDHSSVFGWATDVLIEGNTFRNRLPYNNQTKTGGLVAYEIHGSDTRFINNAIFNYAQGLWVSINLTEEIVSKIIVSNNSATVSATFIDFYSANLSTGPSSESAIHNVSIEGNTIEITNDSVAEDIKAFFKIAARRMPSRVKIANNICRSFSTEKTTVLCLIPVIPDQLTKADQIYITSNKAAGITSGLVCYFGGTTSQDIDRVEFTDNDLGYLIPSPGGILSSADVLLYGINNGKVQSLKVSCVNVITTDNRPTGRGNIKGITRLSLPVSWTGVSIGNGTFHNQISINTDCGFAEVEVGFSAGSTTTFNGEITPTITGLTAAGTVSAMASKVKSNTATNIPGIVFLGSSSISLYNSNGALLNSSDIDSSVILIASAKIPCNSVLV